MYLQKLVIQGFKSFANKSSLEFTPGVTAIVGPNGSGKSNIADAVRWALGEQSLKTLRGKKSDDVIFAGSDKKTRLGYCQVDIHLDNQDRQAPVDYSEIVISRRIYRSGEGEYFINKNKVRLQDILMLLAKSNFGQRSYSIISQGMIDQFLSATPTQRKEFFDEAAGVRQYQIKKEQAENKLKQTKENLNQAAILIQEIEPHLRSLTRQVKRLERREEVNKELKEIQHIYYTGLWHDLKNKKILEENKFNTIDEINKKASVDLENIQNQIQQLALGNTVQEDFQKLQSEYEKITTTKNNLLREQAVLKGRMEVDREKSGDLDLIWLEKKQEQLKNEIKNITSDLEDKQNKYKKFESQLDEKEKDNLNIKDELSSLEKKLDHIKNQIYKNKAVGIPEISAAVSSIYNQQKSLLEKIENANSLEDLKNIKAEAKTLTSIIAQLNHRLGDAGAGDPLEIISIQEKITNSLKSKDKLSMAINDIKVNLQVALEKNNISKSQLEDKEQELEKITKELIRSGTDKAPHEIAKEFQSEELVLSEKIKNIEKRVVGIQNQIGNFNQLEQEKKEGVFSLQKSFSKKQEELNSINSDQNSIKVELAKLETRLEDLEKEMIDELRDEARQMIYNISNPPSANQELFTEIQKLKKSLELIGGIDPQVAEEYKETKERYDFLDHQSKDLYKAIADLEKAIVELEETIKKHFTKAFDEINKQFTQYFKILFNGGNASLSLVKEEKKEEDEPEDDDVEDDETEIEERDEEKKEITNPKSNKLTGEKVVTGIEIHATPPGKKLKGIAMLSGGERALTSIALISAIIHNNPSPFVILDEVDAALDESNSIRFASIVDQLSKKSQFIIITHNRATMEQAHTLYGVTMGDDGVSKLLSINMEEADKVINKQSG